MEINEARDIIDVESTISESKTQFSELVREFGPQLAGSTDTIK